MKRKIVSALLAAFILVVSISCPLAAYADSTTDFIFDTSTGTITGYTGNPTNLIIPSSINGIAVKNIGEGGHGAFQGCTSLISINIPDSVTSIGNYAFSGCSSLSSIIIPNSVTSIGDSAFGGCTSLISIKLPNSITTIGSWEFGNCQKLNTIIFPNALKEINQGMFYQCYSLSTIQIPNSVTSIDYVAFAFCNSLKSITIPESVTTIGIGVFQDCTSLTSIFIPKSVTNIGDKAFMDCHNFSFYGYKNSTAQTYATQNGIPFVSIDDTKTPPAVTGVEDGKTYTGNVTISFDKGTAMLNGQPFKNGTVVSTNGNYTLIVTDTNGNSTKVNFILNKIDTPLAILIPNSKIIGSLNDGCADSKYPTNVTVEIPSTVTAIKASDIIASNNDAVSLYTSPNYSQSDKVGDSGYTLAGNTATLYLSATNTTSGTVKYYQLNIDKVDSTAQYKLSAPATFTKKGANYIATVTIDRQQAEKLADPKLYVVYTIQSGTKQFQTYQCIDISSSDTTTTKDIIVGKGFVGAEMFLVDGEVDWSLGFPDPQSNPIIISMK